MSLCTCRTVSRDYCTPHGWAKKRKLQPLRAPRAGVVRKRKNRVCERACGYILASVFLRAKFKPILTRGDIGV